MKFLCGLFHWRVVSFILLGLILFGSYCMVPGPKISNDLTTLNNCLVKYYIHMHVDLKTEKNVKEIKKNTIADLLMFKFFLHDVDIISHGDMSILQKKNNKLK